MTSPDAKPNSSSTESKLTPGTQLPSEHKPAAWQFSLFSLFELTTAAAIAAALVAAQGWGTLVLSTGLTLAWFNVRGSFVRWQTPRGQVWLFSAAWVLFVVSLLLPALEVFSSYVFGWQAAAFMAQVEWEGFADASSRKNWLERNILSSLLSFCWLTMMNATNLLMLFSPLTLWRLRRGKGQLLANALAVTCVAAWVVPFGEPGYFVGCYVWCASMMLLLVARRMTWRVAVAMVVTALFIGMTVWLGKLNL